MRRISEGKQSAVLLHISFHIIIVTEGRLS